jgi:hypothetical protein
MTNTVHIGCAATRTVAVRSCVITAATAGTVTIAIAVIIRLCTPILAATTNRVIAYADTRLFHIISTALALFLGLAAAHVEIPPRGVGRRMVLFTAPRHNRVRASRRARHRCAHGPSTITRIIRAISRAATDTRSGRRRWHARSTRYWRHMIVIRHPETRTYVRRQTAVARTRRRVALATFAPTRQLALGHARVWLERGRDRSRDFARHAVDERALDLPKVHRATSRKYPRIIVITFSNHFRLSVRIYRADAENRHSTFTTTTVVHAALTAAVHPRRRAHSHRTDAYHRYDVMPLVDAPPLRLNSRLRPLRGIE